MPSSGIICGTMTSRAALPFGQGFFSVLKVLYQRLHTTVGQQHQRVLLLSMVRGNDVPVTMEFYLQTLMLPHQLVT